MTERERVLEEATNFCFYSDTPLGEVSHEQIHNLMADFHLAQSAEITAERDRLKAALAIAANRLEGVALGLSAHGRNIDLDWWIQTHTKWANEARAYLKGKGDGDKGE